MHFKLNKNTSSTVVFFRRLSMLCMIISLFVFSSFMTFANQLSVGWELWYPYQYRDKQQQLIGLDLDILNAINQEIKYNLSYVELPWKRHLQYIKTGYIDIAAGASFTTERDTYAYFSIPYRIEKVSFFVKKGMAKNIKLRKLQALAQSNYIIGIEGGYYYGENFQTLNQQRNFQSHINEVIDLEQNVKMLIKGHIDGFLADPVTMKAFAEKYSVENEFEIHPLEIYQTNIHFMLSKKSCSPETLNAFNQAITQLKLTGKLEQIITSWTAFNNNSNKRKY